jgi:AraC-like DNA-binding protein
MLLINVHIISMATEILDHRSLDRQCERLAALMTRYTNERGNGSHVTAIDKLEFRRESVVSTSLQHLCEPLLVIIVQGKKTALLGEETYNYRVAQYVTISVDLPLRAFVMQATPEQPYLAFKLKLDLRQLCDLLAETQAMAEPLNTSIASNKENSIKGLVVSNADAPLLDCALRLTMLLDTPQDIPILAPMIIREIYYRLLIGEQSEAVRQIATSGSAMYRIAEAIELIKANFTKMLRVEDLARHASMSSSSFHHHFRAVTAMSPVQYQKQLRLLEARRLMLVENADATCAAYQVGYESRSQFSREYSRMFGAPPLRDIERSRIA